MKAARVEVVVLEAAEAAEAEVEAAEAEVEAATVVVVVAAVVVAVVVDRVRASKPASGQASLLPQPCLRPPARRGW